MWGRKKKQHAAMYSPGPDTSPPTPGSPSPILPASTSPVPPLPALPLQKAGSPSSTCSSPAPAASHAGRPGSLGQGHAHSTSVIGAPIAVKPSVSPPQQSASASSLTGAASPPVGPHRKGSEDPQEVLSRRDLPPETCGFKPVELIGQGATGIVYKAVNVKTGEWAAIKLMRRNSKSSASSTASFMKEIEILTRLNHPNIVKVLNHVSTDDHISLVLEYVDGGSLSSIVSKFGRFPESLAAVYMDHVLAGLKYLHDNGVIHRDVKGGNILVTKEGVAKLVDFGCAAAICADMTKRVTVVGTPYWMAPEVVELSGQCPESDIWSVGATIIELITTAPPYWGAPPVSAMFHIVQDAYPPFPQGISQELNDLLVRCFQKDPTRRPSAEVLRTHPWFVKNLHTSELQRPQAATAAPGISELVDTVRTYNGDPVVASALCDTLDSSEEECSTPALSARRASTESQDAAAKVIELTRTVDMLQAKIKKQKQQKKAYKAAVESLQQKCAQQKQQLTARNDDGKTLQDFFYLVTMAARLNAAGKGTEANVKGLYERAQKEGVPWNQWIEWVPRALGGGQKQQQEK